MTENKKWRAVGHGDVEYLNAGDNLRVTQGGSVLYAQYVGAGVAYVPRPFGYRSVIGLMVGDTPWTIEVEDKSLTLSDYMRTVAKPGDRVKFDYRSWPDEPATEVDAIYVNESDYKGYHEFIWVSAPYIWGRVSGSSTLAEMPVTSVVRATGEVVL